MEAERQAKEAACRGVRREIDAAGITVEV